MYPGGKNAVYQKIINLIPPHRVYIEPFLGSGAIARCKRAASINILIDIDPQAGQAVHIAQNGDTDHKWRFVNTDALAWLKNYQFQGDEFVYTDPPYLMSTRRQYRQLYRYELGEEHQHRELLKIITRLPCAVMISSYWSELYEQALDGWYTSTFEAVTRGGSLATEWLWMNYPPPITLHDYRYLGDNFREREKIKRRTNRWIARLEKMSVLERQAMLAALDTIKSGDASASLNSTITATIVINNDAPANGRFNE